MKNKAALVLACIMIVALFTGCGTSKDPGPDVQSETSALSASPTSDVENTEDVSSPYHFAAGKYEADENGFPVQKYEYELPISTTDETLTFWSCAWMPQLIPEEGFGTMELPTAVEANTGINVEYSMMSFTQMQENFSILLASDDLCDIMVSGLTYYSGTIEQAIYEDEIFVNIYDYLEYCPNYIYESAVKNPDDVATYKGVFYFDDMIPAFYNLRSEALQEMNSTIRGDWLAELGLSAEDVVTFDDFYDVLMRFKTEIEGCTYPWAMLNSIELGAGSYTLNAFDTLPSVAAGRLPSVFQIDGKVQFANTTANDLELMTMLNKFYTSGLIYPDWQSATGNDYYHAAADTGEVGYIVNNASGCNDYNNTSVDPDADWVPLKKILRHEGQVIHVGSRLSRRSYGSCTISTSCENIPLAITWCDYRYSDSGAFLYNYGVEGVTWTRDENGNVRLTDFVLNNPDGIGMDWIFITYTLNQLSECGLEDNARKFQYDGGEKFWAMNEYWNDFEHDDIYEWPAGLNLSTEQSDEANLYANDISTYIAENYLMFVDGTKPLSEWDSYVSDAMSVGLTQVKEIYQKVLDDYLG